MKNCCGILEIIADPDYSCYTFYMLTWISKLSPDLFWDTDQSQLDPEKHARWLLERVLHRGRWEDWLLIKKHYSKTKMKTLSPHLRLDGKSRQFLSIYCGS
ncbi:MAG: hypothetical protein JW874_06345 [Spirochaetales bacterium]|nr:hypothetical protein [Spirochaetales bacterium]